ncbi:MAG: DUF4157 domain-containing protein [Moorea sp. SIO3A2]|nr:DUF4157 domain-containing protein [Moorena sp. SIO3A2]
MSANVMRTLESGQYQPETGRREMGLQGKFSFGQPGDRSRQGANHGGQMVVQPKRNMVQRAAQPLTGDSLTYGESMRELSSKKENKTGLPDRLKAGIENLSGFSMDDVRVHYNSEKPAQLQALAYAQGTEIHVGPGQEKHLAHEAWHVVQQKEGRVKARKYYKGMEINDEVGLETEAEEKGRTVLSKMRPRGRAMEAQLGRVATTLGNQKQKGAENPKTPGQVIQCVTFMIGEPSESGDKFPALAASLLEKRTNERAKSFHSTDYKYEQKKSFWPRFTKQRGKEEVYIIGHGYTDQVSGLDANGITRRLGEMGLNSENISKIILVSCATGAKDTGVSGETIARDLAGQMNVDVYAPTHLISVISNLDENVDKSGFAAKKPYKFTVRNTEVEVVSGKGLQKFEPNGKGYAPPYGLAE